MMPLLPSWAPNVHPLVIHFPIVLLIAAAAVDLVDALFERPAWLSAAATSLYTAGAAAAVAAYLTEQAGATALVPGMAHPVINDHRSWALVTACISPGRQLSDCRAAWFPRAGPPRVVVITA
jgi:uncharacterized membrane protein